MGREKSLKSIGQLIHNQISQCRITMGNTTNATAVSLSGQGFWDLRADNNEITNNATSPTNDVLLTQETLQQVIITRF